MTSARLLLHDEAMRNPNQGHTMYRRSLQLLLVFMAVHAASRTRAESWPRGQVFVPAEVFSSRSRMDRVVLESNPRLYLHPTFDPRSDLILVIGMPGWGGRSENFIGPSRR